MPSPASKHKSPGGLAPNWQKKVQHSQRQAQPHTSASATRHRSAGISLSSEVDSDINLSTPTRPTARPLSTRGSQPESSSRATSSGEIDATSADAVHYEYGGFATDDDGLVERYDVKPEKKLPAASRYKVRSNRLL